MVPVIVAAIAGKLSLALLGKMAGLLLEKIFPSSIPSYFDQVYDQIKSIVNQEVTQAQIISDWGFLQTTPIPAGTPQK